MVAQKDSPKQACRAYCYLYLMFMMIIIRWFERYIFLLLLVVTSISVIYWPLFPFWDRKMALLVILSSFLIWLVSSKTFDLIRRKLSRLLQVNEPVDDDVYDAYFHTSYIFQVRLDCLCSIASGIFLLTYFWYKTQS